jgi:hypothetical protein
MPFLAASIGMNFGYADFQYVDKDGDDVGINGKLH